MKTKNKHLFLQSFALGAILTVVFITAAVIFGELYHPFKDWLKQTFYHHWIGKGVIAALIFLIVGFLGSSFASAHEKETSKLLILLYKITIFGFFAILIFYLYEYFLSH